MSDNQKIIRDNKETLETLAESDLRCAKWACKLLESIEGDSSYSIEESDKTDTTPIEESQNRSEEHSIEANTDEPAGSIFAY